MRIGDMILIRAKVVDFDSNPHGSAIMVEVNGFAPKIIEAKDKDKYIKFWIHRLDQSEVIANAPL